MMKPIYLIALLALFSAACTNKTKSSDKNVSGHDTSVKKAEMAPLNKPTLKIKPDTLIIDTTKKLLSYSANELFSDTVFKDHFSITLYGESIAKGGVILAIHDHNNKQLYSEQYNVTDLLGDDELPNDKQIGDTIKLRMAHFFDKDRFVKPAISKDEKFDEDLEDPSPADKQNWLDIKTDPTAVSFIYSIGYETTFGIAFSKKAKKVVIIFAQD
jgi:hypothetical protein